MEGLDLGMVDRFTNAGASDHGTFIRDDLTVVAVVVR
jgi:hypothetical protein